MQSKVAELIRTQSEIKASRFRDVLARMGVPPFGVDVLVLAIQLALVDVAKAAVMLTLDEVTETVDKASK